MGGLIVRVQEIVKLVLGIAAPLKVAQGVEVVEAGWGVVAPDLDGSTPLPFCNV